MALDSFVVRVWDSNSIVVEGSIVVVEVLVFVLQTVDGAVARHTC